MAGSTGATLRLRPSYSSFAPTLFWSYSPLAPGKGIGGVQGRGRGGRGFAVRSEGAGSGQSVSPRAKGPTASKQRRATGQRKKHHVRKRVWIRISTGVRWGRTRRLCAKVACGLRRPPPGGPTGQKNKPRVSLQAVVGGRGGLVVVRCAPPAPCAP